MDNHTYSKVKDYTCTTTVDNHTYSKVVHDDTCTTTTVPTMQYMESEIDRLENIIAEIEKRLIVTEVMQLSLLVAGIALLIHLIIK